MTGLRYQWHGKSVQSKPHFCQGMKYMLPGGMSQSFFFILKYILGSNKPLINKVTYFTKSNYKKKCSNYKKKCSLKNTNLNKGIPDDFSLFLWA